MSKSKKTNKNIKYKYVYIVVLGTKSHYCAWRNSKPINGRVPTFSGTYSNVICSSLKEAVLAANVQSQYDEGYYDFCIIERYIINYPPLIGKIVKFFKIKAVNKKVTPATLKITETPLPKWWDKNLVSFAF